MYIRLIFNVIKIDKMDSLSSSLPFCFALSLTSRRSVVKKEMINIFHDSFSISIISIGTHDYPIFLESHFVGCPVPGASHSCIVNSWPSIWSTFLWFTWVAKWRTRSGHSLSFIIVITIYYWISWEIRTGSVRKFRVPFNRRYIWLRSFLKLFNGSFHVKINNNNNNNQFLSVILHSLRSSAAINGCLD